MSDFLDRLAARAIGSDTALVPRLPSFFESPRLAPIMPWVDPGEVSWPGRDTPTATTAVSPAVAMQPENAASLVEPSSAPVMPVDRPVPSKLAPTAAYPSRDPQPTPALGLVPMSHTMVEPFALRSTAERAAATSPSPVTPRLARIVPERRDPAPLSATGSLRPASAQVFGTPHASPAPASSSHAVAPRAPATSHVSSPEAAHAPVIHVSIGRLEVRASASAATATPSRRRDGPQPASLDDYLRQRGDKVPS